MKTKQIFIAIAVAVVAFFVINQCSEDRRNAEYKKEKQRLKKELDSIRKDALKDSLRIDSLQKKIGIKEIENITLKKKVDSVEKEITKIPKKVKELPLSSIDSIIKENTKTEEDKRKLVTKIEEYPLLKQQTEFLKQENKSLEETIDLIKEQSSTKDSLLFKKNAEIKNLSSQVNLCEKQLDKKNSSLFLYGQVNLNGWTQYGVGVDYTIKDKVIIGTSATYDSFYEPVNVNVNIKLGFKIK